MASKEICSSQKTSVEQLDGPLLEWNKKSSQLEIVAGASVRPFVLRSVRVCQNLLNFYPKFSESPGYTKSKFKKSVTVEKPFKFPIQWRLSQVPIFIYLNLRTS